MFAELLKEQRQAQEYLVKSIREAQNTAMGPSTVPRPEGNPTYYCLSKLNPEDDVEAFLYAFKQTAMVVQWLAGQ